MKSTSLGHNYKPVLKLGTTIMAAEFKGGVVLGADTRASSGSFVVNRYRDKLSRITDHIYCCLSGCAEDTCGIIEEAKDTLFFRRPSPELKRTTRVLAFATIIREIIEEQRGEVLAGIIVAGWDEELGGQVYSIFLDGFFIRQRLAVGGCGSYNIMGYVENQYKKDMNENDCIQYLVSSIKLAISHDYHTGGVVQVGVIDECGFHTKIFYNTLNGLELFRTEDHNADCCGFNAKCIEEKLKRKKCTDDDDSDDDSDDDDSDDDDSDDDGDDDNSDDDSDDDSNDDSNDDNDDDSSDDEDENGDDDDDDSDDENDSDK